MQGDETGHARVVEVARGIVPWGRELVVQALDYDSGMRLARMRIREGHRFTTLDLDDAATEWLIAALRKALDQATAD